MAQQSRAASRNLRALPCNESIAGTTGVRHCGDLALVQYWTIWCESACYNIRLTVFWRLLTAICSPEVERLMKRMQKLPVYENSLSTRASLGGKISHYRGKQHIYSQGMPAYTLFYIQEGGVRLTTRSKNQPSAVTAILGVGDFFGELCLVGLPLRTSTAVALTSSSIRVIKKTSMIRKLRQKNKMSNSFASYLMTSIKKYQDHVAELLTAPAEQRLARVLLRLAHLDRGGPPVGSFPTLSHQVLAEMVGTTRPRVNLFMNQFRKRGFISYNGHIEVHKSLNTVLRHRPKFLLKQAKAAAAKSQVRKIKSTRKVKSH